jgi:hypothetical protein
MIFPILVIPYMMYQEKKEKDLENLRLLKFVLKKNYPPRRGAYEQSE